MPITYQYEIDSKIVRAKATGLITTKDILYYVTKIIEDTKIEKGFVEIVDFQLVRDLVVRYSELSPFPEIWKKYREKGCKAVIIHTPTDLSYGTFRMLQTIIGLKDEVAEDHFIVVRSKEEIDNKLSELLA